MGNGVDIEIANGVGTLTFNRPEVLNALDPAMAGALREATEGMEHDPEVRCVVVRGAGDHFMAGGDVAYFQQSLGAFKHRSNHTLSNLFDHVHATVRSIRRMPKPVVASVGGAAAGIGLSLILTCDLAIAADNSKFNVAYCRIGACPDGGCSVLLTRAVGLKHAMELALLSESFDAEYALHLGLINRVVPVAALKEQTDKLTQRLVAGPALAYAHTKALINASLQYGFEDQLEQERARFVNCAASAEFAEGVSAFLDKRTPKFE